MATLTSVTTDTNDYPPGAWAEITASGFDPGSTVTFQVQHAGDPGADGIWGTLDDVIVDLGGEGHEAWSVEDGSALDQDGAVNGTVVTSWYVNPDDSLNWHFLLTATAQGQETASAVFTDSYPADATLDLTTSGNSGEINGALFSNVFYAAGTGLIDPFVRIQQNGFEEGYNSSAEEPQQFNETAQYNTTYNKALSLTEIPVVYIYNPVTDEFSSYRQILLDINENRGNGQQYLSLDALQIYQSDSATLSSFTGNYTSTGGFIGGSSSLIYNLDASGDHWVALDFELNAGSGVGDIAVYIPETYFNEGQFVYLYSSFGRQTESAGYKWESSDGFEEWSVSQEGPLSVSQIVGSKFIDSDQDGSWDAGESGQEGVHIYLDQNLDGVLNWVDQNNNDLWDLGEGERWTTTDVSGAYMFDNLAAGLGAYSTYYVSEVVPEGYSQTAPVTGSYLVGVGTETATASGGVIAVEIATADEVYALPAFGNHLNFIPNPSISIDKQFVNVTGGNGNALADAAGDVLNYTVLVTDEVQVTLTDVEVTDPLTGQSIMGVTLEPGESQTYESSYTLTQEDLDTRGGGDGDIDNTATADSEQAGPVSDSAEAPLVYDPRISIDKITVSGGKSGDGIVVNAGDSVTWEYTVINTGNTTLSDVTVTDDNGQFTDIIPVYQSGDGNNNGKLDVGEEWIYEAAGIAISGSYTNTATVAAYATPTVIVTDTDSSSYTGKPPTTALIAPTNTTIQQYIDGSAKTFQQYYTSATNPDGEIQYSTKPSGAISQTNPGVFFYFTGLSELIKYDSSADLNDDNEMEIKISQTNDLGGAFNFAMVKNGAQLYKVTDTNNNGQIDASDSLVTLSTKSFEATDTGGNVSVTFNPSAADLVANTTSAPDVWYLVSVKYNVNSVVGKNPSGQEVEYTFETTFAGSTETCDAGIVLAPKFSSGMHLAGDEGSGARAVNEAQVRHVTEAAIAWWDEHADLSDEQAAMLRETSISIEDLGHDDVDGGDGGDGVGWMLAETGVSGITLDDDAAEHGWSLGLGGVAQNKVDLFSVLVHEMGHVLGKTHEEMGATLAVGERMLPVMASVPPEDDAGQGGMPSVDHMLGLVGSATAEQQMALHMS